MDTTTLERNSLRKLLHERVVAVNFKKKNGTDRLMKATTNFKLIPTENHPKPIENGTPSTVSEDLFKVFDVEKEAWRSFNYDQVNYWTINV